MSKCKLKSEIISDFLGLIEECKIYDSIADDKIDLANKATQDMLHKIEFSKDYRERGRAATQLHYIREDRRHYKDIKEETEIVVSYYEENKKAVERLKKTLGELRKIEKYHENRSYKPRVIKED